MQFYSVQSLIVPQIRLCSSHVLYQVAIKPWLIEEKAKTDSLGETRS